MAVNNVYVSRLESGEYVIDDQNYLAEPGVAGKGDVATGYQTRDILTFPEGQCGFAAPFNFPTIPRSEWPELIREREQRGRILSQLADAAGLQRMNQGSMGYCWAYGAVCAVHYRRIAMGLPHLQLSACSVAGPVKNFRNQGGWSGEAVAYMVRAGVVPEYLWPNGNQGANRRYLTAENLRIGQEFIIEADGWIDVVRNNFDQIMTLLLMDIPCPIGLSWWGHLICAVDPLVLGNNAFGFRYDNSWGLSYGTRGRGVMAEARGRPTECVAPVTIRPSIHQPRAGSPLSV
jgi:hypothetical protein